MNRKEPLKNARQSTTVPRAVDNELPASERSALNIYMKELGKTPLLNAEEELILARKVQEGNKKAKEHMIKANLRLVVKIAHDYCHLGLPLLDLISEGNIGLMKAIDRFDPDRGGKLSTYAAWWIKQGIKRALANQSKTIRLPVHLIEKVSRIRKICNRLEDELKREPTNDEIAREMNMPVSKIAHIREISVRPASLDQNIKDQETGRLIDVIGDTRSPKPDEQFAHKAIIEDVQAIIKELDEREAKIIKMRFGLDDTRPKTLEETGLAMGLTRERIRQLQFEIFRKLREKVAERERHHTEDELYTEQQEKLRLQVINEFILQKKAEKNTTESEKPSKKISERILNTTKKTNPRKKPS